MKQIFLVALVFLVSQHKVTLCVEDYQDIFNGPEKTVDKVTDSLDDIYGEFLTEANTPEPAKKIILKPTPKPTPTPTPRQAERPTGRPTIKPDSTSISKASTGGRYDFIEDPIWGDEVCELHEKCVPYYLCNEDGEINKDGSFLIDPRFDAGDFPPETCPQLEKCCERVETVLPPENLCGKDHFDTPKTCGYRNKDGLGGKVSGVPSKGSYAQYAEFPWTMAVLIQNEVNGTVIPVYKSGGSLIHPKVVMTTAHSIAGIDPRKIVVRGGEWDTQTENEMCSHVDRKVERVIRHKEYNRQNLRNDIALLILDEKFELTPFINTICLPPAGTNFDNQRCLTGGWGKDKFGKKGIYQVFLKKVELPVVPHKDCQTKLRRTRLGNDFELHDKFLCAGGEKGIDVCDGDGGSALVCEMEDNPGYYYQAGMVVGGIDCGEADVPGFYLDIAKYDDWINDKLSQID